MRILYVTHGYYYGSGKVLRTLITGMIARGHEVAVISQAAPSEEWWPSVPESLRVYEYGTLLKMVPTVMKALHEFEPDVMDGQMLRESALAAFAWRLCSRRIPFVHVEHGRIDDRSPLGRLALRIVAQYATRVVFPSRSALHGWGSRIAVVRAKGVPICNAVEVPTRSGPRGAIRESLNVPTDGIMLVNAASVNGRKNQKMIVSAMAALSEKHQRRVFLAVAGGVHEEQERDDIAAIARRAGLSDQIFLLGLRSDVADLYAASDIAVLSSTSESFGLAVIEGMAAGKPVISTACGGPEDIVVDGETGFLVPIDDAEAMARAIEKLIEDPDLARRMGEAGRRRVEERYSVEAFCDAYERLYREMIESPTR